MLIFGKLAGAIVGTLTFGFPWGTMIGFILGHFFDRGLLLTTQNYYLGSRDWTTAKAQQAFFNATFQIMGHLAKADGRVSKREIAMAENIMNRMRLTPELRQRAIDLFNQGKDQNLNLQLVMSELVQHCDNNITLLQIFFDIQQQAALVDGLSLKKQVLLQEIARLLGLHNFSGFHQYYREQSTGQQSYQPPPTEDPYAILEVNKDADYKTIKHAYRKLMNQHHPDKLVSQGLPPEMIKLATEKTQKIQRAYENICNSRGFRH